LWALVALVVTLVLAATAVVVTRPQSTARCAPVRVGSTEPPSGSARGPGPEGQTGLAGLSGLAIGFGYDSVVERADSLAEMVSEVDQLDPAAVSVSAGRVDWTTFPWEGHPESWAQPVVADRCDFLARAQDALGTRPDGSRRARILVVDALVTGWIERDPSVAGVDAQGVRAQSFASMAQLESGEVGERIVELVGDVAREYTPEVISLTELFADRYTFGDDDLASFRAHSGQPDWPRTASGGIEESSPQVYAWRSHVIAVLVERAREAAARADVPLLMEVRVNWSDPTTGRPDSGQDYALLMDSADQLVSWDYFALGRRSPGSVGEAVRAREERWPGRWVSSVGLWGGGGATAGPAEVSAAVEAAWDGGSRLVWVTPESRFTPSHWEALRALTEP
jgi:hypothetical protein